SHSIRCGVDSTLPAARTPLARVRRGHTRTPPETTKGPPRPARTAPSGRRLLLVFGRFLSLRLLVLVDGHEAVEVHSVAVGVDDLDLAEHNGDRLVARDITHDRLKLVALLQRLDEVLGAHAVLARCLNQVLGELFLRDLDLEVLRD